MNPLPAAANWRGSNMQQIKNPWRNVLIIFLGLLWIGMDAPCLYADHDTSLRTDLNFSYTFNKKFRAVSYVFIQADDEMSNYDYAEWGVGLRYQTPITWLSCLVFYQQGYTKDDGRHWELEQRPSINLNASTNFFNFRIYNQIRYEHRIRADWNDFRIKNTLEISRPVMFFQPYFGWELYYENSDKAFMLNRVKLGINKSIGKHVVVGPYYRIDFSNNNSSWEWTRQLIGFQMTINY